MGCVNCGGGRSSAVAMSKVVDLSAIGDIRKAYNPSELVWVRVQNLGSHNQTIPSPTGKVEGGYAYAANGAEFMAHVDDVKAWPRVFAKLSRTIEPLDSQKKAEPIEVRATEENTAPAPSGKAPKQLDDLTQLDGIGPAGAAKLLEAEIVNFEELASLTPERLVEILGKPTDEKKAAAIIEAAGNHN